jgi:hypothetical protein
VAESIHRVLVARRILRHPLFAGLATKHRILLV